MGQSNSITIDTIDDLDLDLASAASTIQSTGQSCHATRQALHQKRSMRQFGTLKRRSLVICLLTTTDHKECVQAK